jgi:hypothetical protein
MAEVLKTQEQFSVKAESRLGCRLRRPSVVIPAKAGIQDLNGIACGDTDGLIAASAPRAGPFSLFAQKKGRKESAPPGAALFPALLAPAGAAMLGGSYGSRR